MNAITNFSTKNEAEKPSNPSHISQTDATRVIAFQLGEREYGIDVRQVQRCRSYQSLTWIANGPTIVKGVAISDGVILPIVDMRIAVHAGPPTATPATAVIILHILGRTLGLVVDSVSDVICLTPGEVKPLAEPGSVSALETGYLDGIANYEGRSLILLDIQKLLHDTGVEEAENPLRQYDAKCLHLMN